MQEQQQHNSQTDWQQFIAEHSFKDTPATETSGLCELSSWQLLTVTGPDAHAFLQGQLSCDMNLVKGSQAQLGACISLKGRVIANFIVHEHENQQGYRLICPPTSLGLIEKVLKKYAIFSKVSIGEDTAPLALAVLIKDRLPESLPHFTIPALKENFVLASLDEMKALWQEMDRQNKVLPAKVFEQLLTEQALVFIKPETSEQFTAQEINLDLCQGISFRKGCYTGQEVVARLHYRGKPKRRVFIGELQIGNDLGQIRIGEQLLDHAGKEQGHLVQIVANSKAAHCLLSMNIEQAHAFMKTNAQDTLTLGETKLKTLRPPPYPLNAQD